MSPIAINNTRRQSVSASSPPTSIPIPGNPRSLNISGSVGATSPGVNGLSTSPSLGFNFGAAGAPSSLSTSASRRAVPPQHTRSLTAFLPPSFPTSSSSPSNATTQQIRVLLLENISQEAAEYLRGQGYHVDHYTKAWSEGELVEKLGSYQAVGIRSKTKITEKVVKAAGKLLTIGCFCIGTNQVDLKAAAAAGIAVFNSPFSNSRSVAELVISEVISLSRQLTLRDSEMHAGIWNKVSKGCWEIRGKTLGIVGYGHIGSQLSVLSEAFGMSVLYYDVMPIMPLGSAKQVDSLDDLLSQSDFVTLHVPELPETINMIGDDQIALMKDGSYLLNNSRGKVVDLSALASALESGKLAGAAVDVYPSEPGSNGPGFNENLGDFIPRLRNCKNLILTPHIGGSTEEAQRMIGAEVGTSLTRFLNTGSSQGSVNFPEVDLRAIKAEDQNHIRVCFVHQNTPGVLKTINNLLSSHNIEKQVNSDSRGDIAYMLCDISGVSEEEVKDIYESISSTSANILTRLLY